MHYNCIVIPLSQLYLLTCFLTAVSGAVLRYDGTLLTGPLLNVTLTVGEFEAVSCVQTTGPASTSIVWYDPQGQLVSRNNRDEVRQTVAGRAAHLIWHSYQQNQGGKYECRVAVPGNNLEKLSVCIGEWYILGVAVDYV